MTKPPDVEELTLPEPAHSILRRTRRILDEHVTPHTPGGDGWKIGGGTILAARWGHRESCDLDLLVHPHTETAHLEHRINPELTRRMTEAGATHLNFESLIEIHFETGRIEILRARPTPRIGHRQALLDGCATTTLATSQILSGKMLNRSLRPPVRDLYDIAVSSRREPGALQIAVNSLSSKAMETLLLCWELARDQYAEDALSMIEGVPAEYTPIQADPASHAIESLEGAMYRRVLIQGGHGRVTVHTQCRLGPNEHVYETIRELQAGFEKHGLNALATVSGFNPHKVRSKTTAAMQSGKTVTVLDLQPDRRTATSRPNRCP